MRNHTLITGLLLITSVSLINAQYGRQRRADAMFNSFAYAKAITSYQDMIDNNYNTDYAKRKIADAYTLLRDPENAVKYYADVVQQKDIDPTYYLRYAQALRGIKKYKESRNWLKKYRETAKGKVGNVERMIKNDKFVDEIYQAKQRYEITESPYNSAFSDFGAYTHDSVTYIASTRDDSGLIKRLYGWNLQPFLDIYKTEIDTSGTAILTKISGDVNTKVHEGSMTISADGNTMYFTRTNYLNKKGKDENGISNLKIYRATKVDGKWDNIIELPFNSDDFSTGHPTLSKDGKTLYFASDSKEGFGGSDLYKVSILENGSYSTPENLGDTINTPLNELFPFIHENGTLFFSSDGHQGLGQLDIFATIQDDMGKVVDILNLGLPVNSNKDDFSYYLAPDGINGFISSNRIGGTGDDDIYSFVRIPQITLNGTVTDIVNQEPIANAMVKIMDESNEVFATVQTDKNGYYEYDVDMDTQYNIEASAPKYISQTKTLFTKKPESGYSLTLDFELEPIKKLEVLADIDINKIYFDFDRYNIRRDAGKELDKVVDLMINKYPEMIIAIGSHTDSRGADAYNLRLSQNRALATYRYLTKKGVPKNRIENYQGFGEMELITPCDDGQKCSEEEHELNRRSEFAVVQMEAN
ncbi:OmpA family protein [Spongiivirga sp. MCCC 1A20706]|uniref:OmpA family protein n=1 Tax=Spongiivirga sp. MCCC 1A20706 TaxID=3160963 RepID=UPI0039779998